MRIFMGKIEIFKKIVGRAVNGLKSAPENAATYNLIRGKGPKGNFSVLSFFDCDGNILQWRHIYKNGSDLSSVHTYLYKYGDNKRLMHKFEYLNNNLTKLSEIEAISDTSGLSKDFWMFEKNFYDSVDYHKIKYLSPGQKPKSISYNTFWDGKKPNELELNGIDNTKFPKKNTEYLPLLGDFNSYRTINARANHILKIQERNYNLEGVLPDVKIVSSKELMLDSGTMCEGGVPGGNCDFNGQIKISEDSLHSIDMLELIGHEARHSKDMSMINQLQENVKNGKIMPWIDSRFCIDKYGQPFAKKCRRKKVIPNESNLGMRIEKYQKQWDIYGNKPWELRAEEVRAEKSGKAELKKYYTLVDLICESVNAKFRPI